MANTVRCTICIVGYACLVLTAGCAGLLGDNKAREAVRDLPSAFAPPDDVAGPSVAAQQQWDTFFADPHLKALIETALRNNQELNIRLQEIIIANAEVGAAWGEIFPKLDAGVGAGIEKVGSHTSQGVSDEAHHVDEHLPDFSFGLRMSWEIDVWGKLRNAKNAAVSRYLATVEGKNFVITELVAEIAESYWELVALDKQLETVGANLEIQQAALELVTAKKAAGRGTQLEVQRFQAEVLKNQGRMFELEQQRVVVENRINFLVGRFPQPVARDDAAFMAPAPDSIATGLPSELLENRPDVRAASYALEAAQFDTEVAKARFFPSLSIDADVGYRSFNPLHLIDTPQSLVYNVVGNLVAPLLNRTAIEADYKASNARQFQAVYEYERTLLQAFTEVVNELTAIKNLAQRSLRVSQQVATLSEAIEMATTMYRSAHADYLEVLLTQRDFIEAQLELIETKKEQLQAYVAVYKALGGGWRTDEEASP